MISVVSFQVEGVIYTKGTKTPSRKGCEMKVCSHFLIQDFEYRAELKKISFIFRNQNFEEMLFWCLRLDMKKIKTDVIYEHLQYSAKSSEPEN